MQIKYVCECGCELAEDEVYWTKRQQKSGGTKRQGYRCKKHHGWCTHRLTKCQWDGCTEILKSRMIGYPKKYCAKHRRAANVMAQHAYIANKSRKENTPDINRGDYCIFHNSCKAMKKNCIGCHDYVPIFPGVDPERMHRVMFG